MLRYRPLQCRPLQSTKALETVPPLCRPFLPRQCHRFSASISSWSGCSSPFLSSSNTSKPCVQRPKDGSRLITASRHSSRRRSSGGTFTNTTTSIPTRLYTSTSLAASSTKWLARQKSDPFTKEAKLADLKSRAAFKLLQINDKYHILRPGMTVVDLGFAPGSWSQVAIDLVRPGLGRVVGVDVIPVAPPKGVSGIQGDFLSIETQERLRDLLRDETAGRVHRHELIRDADVDQNTSQIETELSTLGLGEREDTRTHSEHGDKCVDVVLSDMSAPWEMTSGMFHRSISNPYYRMMNTSGNRFRDHTGSMDLCRSALYFAFDTLKVGGHFVCKFYQGAEDKQLEKQLRAMFAKVHREKPESSRAESREAFFVALKRQASADRASVFDDGS